MVRLVLAVCLAGTVVVAQETRKTPPSPDNMVLAAQVMLDTAGFSSGEIDGKAGANFGRAVAAYQKSRGLTASGKADDATLDRLKQDFKGQPPVVSYTIADADIAGPFQPDIPKDLEAQSKLPSLDYRNALEAIAEKFHASPALIESLNPGQTFTQTGTSITVPNVPPLEPFPPPTETKPSSGAKPSAPANTKPSGVRIVVTKKTSALTVEDADGRVLFFAPVTTGSQHDPLPIGKWKVTGVQRMPVFHYNPDLFWDASPQHSKAKIPAGPNNPVGIAWIDLSKPHYGIHGTPEPSQIGHVQSHGCVRMTNWDVRRVMEWAQPGTLVVFQR
jgi:lipoprotein-anchoring transpeptidase ErfK/SrfK